MDTDRPTLPKGWEWTSDFAAYHNTHRLNIGVIAMNEIKSAWHWRVYPALIQGGTSPTALEAAAAAERAVIEWAESLVREVKG